MPLLDYLQLALTDGVGPITLARMIEALGSAPAACAANVSQLRKIEGIGSAKAQKIHDSLRDAASEAQRQLAKSKDMGLKLICLEDAAYPPLLRSIPDPPAVLFVKGALEDRDLNGIAIVGSRRCSLYGREQAERFAALLAGAGFTIVSGGARGVDSSAHRGALLHPHGRTIAVLGCGIDTVYPPENASLFDQIAARGAVVSEYALGTPPTPENFPRRNRIISGMSRGVLVVEADERSGALVTARQAIEDHNRPVFALPGRVDNALSAGPHRLIREGAVLTRNLDDILEGLDPLPHDLGQMELFPTPLPVETPVQPSPPVDLSTFTPRQLTILKALTTEPTAIDVLMERTALAAHEILQEMTLLTLRGQVTRIDGQTYAKKKLH